MNLLNGIVLKTDDNIDLLLSMIDIDNEIPKINTHYHIDKELSDLFDDEKDDKVDHFYMSQLYQTLLAIFHENCELRKKVDVLAAVNELLKSHIAGLTSTEEPPNDQSFNK